ncbi:hypothetical protein ACFPN2_02215 [Steroidobacter flavus]|uniref:Uncharacterized protein n=1 Tax=Steroidobacter flavus TaxID=1842136 RepID=A0ABV8SN14_9GAMM
MTTSLADAVAEFNRYSQARIKLDDAELGSLRITGVFATDRNEVFVSAVIGAFPLEAEARLDGSYLLKSR